MAKFVAFNGESVRELAAQFLALAETAKSDGPAYDRASPHGHDFAVYGRPRRRARASRSSFALYEPAEHRSLATRFGHDVGAATLCFRSLALWLLGYPEAASAELDHALKDARETGHAANADVWAGHDNVHPNLLPKLCAANASIDECIALAEEKGTANWKMQAIAHRGCVLALLAKSTEAIQTITSGIDGWRSIGATVFAPFWLSHLALAYADIGKFDEAWR